MADWADVTIRFFSIICDQLILFCVNIDEEQNKEDKDGR